MSPRRPLHAVLSLPMLLVAMAVASCDSARERDARIVQPYHLVGSVWQDSLHSDSVLYIYVDRHSDVVVDTVPVVRGRFAYDGETSGVDALHLYDTRGIHNQLYVFGGMDTEIELDSLGRLSLLSADPLNGWLDETIDSLSTLDRDAIARVVDSLCAARPSDVATCLLLWRLIPNINDSLSVRRALGSLRAEAKPDWLMADIDAYWDSRSAQLRKGLRLPNVQVAVGDTVFDLKSGRRDGLVVLFWSDEVAASVDTLRRLLPRVAREFGLYDHEERFFAAGRRPKRAEFLTVCVSAADSAAWRRAVDGLPGYHAYPPGGLSDPAFVRWTVESLPTLVVLDQFNNISSINGWGDDMAAAIRRLPNKALPPTGRK